MWKDPNFDVAHAAQSLVGKQVISIPLESKYPGAVLFKKEKSTLCINQFDILQGNIGDCWLLSAFASIAHSMPKLLERLFIYSDRELGYSVVDILGHHICVDHYIPVYWNEGLEVIGPNITKENEYWPIILEKSIIKVMAIKNICPSDIFHINRLKRLRKKIKHSSPDYNDVNGGFPRWAFSLLLGIKLDPITTVAVPDIISLFQNTSYTNLICACTSTEKNDSHSDDGFVYGHAYSVLKVDKERELIRLRNPWGKYENTEYDDFTDDGEFWVNVDTFKTRFPILCMAKILFKSDENEVKITRGSFPLY